MDTSRILYIAAFAGEIMLQSGGETYRVEETISRICASYGVKDADSFVTPTGIIISVTDVKGTTISKVIRVKHRTVDLDKISEVNDLSRRICAENLSLDFVEKALDDILNNTKYSNRTLIFASSIAAGFFTLLFGGNYKDFFVSLFIGAVIEVLSIALSRIETNAFFINAIGGATASFIALLSTSLGIGNNTDKIVIGSLMLLVPGLAITNAIRDSIAGDLVAGTSRTAEAFLTAIAIAVGSGIVFTLWIKYFGGAFI
ncbi:Inner membrane protein YjjP [Clostridium liquoris]|uniref:Inner membrane protein YjjP n=1 Tax=Clostridium liquoris TaxID=1289519 RepID=A0A2T0B2M3_9CLOT|nr:threonine/serine exporter family protein [Clostridium liquoris]PRR78139.1 Inner membrane protein YjjP [Clostridium liquoris]